MTKILSCIASFCLLCLPVIGQDLDETYRLGKTNFALANYQTASLAFERVIFFGQGKYDAEVYELLGKTAQIQADYSRAANYFNQASLVASSEIDQSRNKIAQAANLLLSKEPVLAKIELLGLSNNLPDSLLRQQSFLLGVAEFSTGAFAESRISFKQALTPEDVVAKNRIDSLFNVLAGIRHPNPKTARILSIVLPGLGQFYSGDIKNGINSLLLTGGFLTVGLVVAANYSLLDALVSVIPWIQRYYTGGFKRAGNIAADKLKQKQDKIYQEILNTFDSPL